MDNGRRLKQVTHWDVNAYHS